eukprot:gene3784-4709_t
MTNKSIDPADIIKLYHVNPPLDLIDKLFDKDAEFEGCNLPTFKVKGLQNIHEIFKAICVYAKDLKIVKYSSTNSQHFLMIDTLQKVTLRFFPFMSFEFRMILHIHKNKENKIIRFEEITDLESVIHNIPLLNYAYFSVMKPSLGYLMIKFGENSKLVSGKSMSENKIATTLERLSEKYTEKMLMEEKNKKPSYATVTTNVWKAQPVSH